MTLTVSVKACVRRARFCFVRPHCLKPPVYFRLGRGSQRSILSDSTFDYYNTGSSSDGRMHSGTYPRQKQTADLHNGTYPLRYRGSTMQQEESVQVPYKTLTVYLLPPVTTYYTKRQHRVNAAMKLGIQLSLKSMELLQNGLQLHSPVTRLISMREVSLSLAINIALKF